MGNNSVPKFIFRLSRFPVYRGFVLGRFYCINVNNCEVPCATLEVTTSVLLRVPAFGKVTEWLLGLQRSAVHGERCKERGTRTA